MPSRAAGAARSATTACPAGAGTTGVGEAEPWPAAHDRIFGRVDAEVFVVALVVDEHDALIGGRVVNPALNDARIEIERFYLIAVADPARVRKRSARNDIA